MSWITVIWSMTAGICLTLGAVYFLIWTKQRARWANLVFSISAAAAAAFAFLDMFKLRAQSTEEYGMFLQWTLSIGMIESLSMAWFIRLYLQAGRLWLLWLITGLRAIMLLLNIFPGPNFYFREITSLQQVPLLGELISRPLGILHPWAFSLQLSLLLIILFVIDATYSAIKKRGARHALLLGGVTVLGFTLALVFYGLYLKGILPSPFSGQLMLLVILSMAYELSREVLGASQLAGELRESEQRFILAADAANLGVWIRDLKKDKFWATDHWRELLGFAKSEQIDLEAFLQRLHPGDRESIRETLAEAAAGGGRYDTEYRVMLPDGGVRWISSRGRAEFNGDGKPALMRGVSVDVTERKNAENELTQHRNELSHLSRVTTLSELSGSIAHELNQPLAIILTNAQAAQRLLNQDPPNVAETREILSDIVSEVQRGGEVIRRLRALLKPGQTQLQPLFVNEIIEDVLRIARSDLIRRGVTVHTTLAGKEPQILGDRIQLQQVLLNLILNASDAMAVNPPGRRDLFIKTDCRDSILRISVTDCGCGLPSNPESIFQPFYTTKKEGLGLGLSICRTIVTAHKGRLWAEANNLAENSFDQTNCDKGATLQMEFPLTEERL